jgi:YggT family protein
VERSLISIIDIVVNTVSIILILYALMSFAPLDPYHPVRRTLTQIAEPIVQPFRNLIPPIGMFDFSVLVALIVIQIGGELLKVMIRSAF